MTNHGVQSITEAASELESVITGLYEKSGNFGLSREQFVAILSQIAAKYLPAGASPQETAELFTYSIVVADNDRLESARSASHAQTGWQSATQRQPWL